MDERGLRINALNFTIVEEQDKTKRCEEKNSLLRKDIQELLGQQSTWGKKYTAANDKIDSQKMTIKILGGTLIVITIVVPVVAVLTQ